MALVGFESRNRVGIEWFDSEVEAEARGEQAKREPDAWAANLGIIQVGRDRSLDRTAPNGQKQYAVVVP